MNEFKVTDFVQVQHSKLLESGEPVDFWRNALYVGRQDDNHIVIYTDGTSHVLNSNIAIRQAKA